LNKNIDIEGVSKGETIWSISMPGAPIGPAFTWGDEDDTQFCLCARAGGVKRKFHRGTELVAFDEAHPVPGIPTASPVILNLPQFFDFLALPDGSSIWIIDIFNKS
jgi:hypothetical protein